MTMTTLYFILGIIFVLYEMIIGFNAKHVTEFKHKLEDGVSKLDPRDPAIKRLVMWGSVYILIQLLYLVWAAIGVFMSSQILLFAILLSSGLLWSAITKWVGPKYAYVVLAADSAVSATLLAFIVYNHFHNVANF